MAEGITAGNNVQQGPQFVPFERYLEKENTIEELEKLATTDLLTGGLNREGLRRYLEKAQAPKALLLVDATNFKAINDKFGYGVGDRVIQLTYELLRKVVRPGDVIARLGGDEFVIILNSESESEAEEKHDQRASSVTPEQQIAGSKVRIAQEVLSFVENPNPDFHLPNLKAVNFNLSVGGAEWVGGINLEDLIAQAERPMKIHKEEQHESGRYR